MLFSGSGGRLRELCVKESSGAEGEERGSGEEEEIANVPN